MTDDKEAKRQRAIHNTVKQTHTYRQRRDKSKKKSTIKIKRRKYQIIRQNMKYDKIFIDIKRQH